MWNRRVVRSIHRVESKMDFSHNGFSGPIAPEISHCKLLTFVDLSRNELSLSRDEKCPKTLGEIKKKKALSILSPSGWGEIMVFMRTANQLAERRCSSGWGRAAAGSRIDRWSVTRRKEGRCRDGAWGASGQRNHGFQIGKMNSDCLRTLIGEAVDAAGARDGEEDAGVAGEEAASGGGVKLQGKWKAMNQTPRATARLVREVTGMPTTPNMWSTPARERALAIRTLPSIVGGCELWEFGASVLVSTIVVVKVFKQCDRRRESEVSKFGFVRRAAKARLPPAGEAELLSS